MEFALENGASKQKLWFESGDGVGGFNLSMNSWVPNTQAGRLPNIFSS